MSMKMHESVLLTLLVALLVVPTVGCGGTAETAAVTSTATVAAAPAMTDAAARALMVKAAEVSTKFTSYHASAITTQGNSEKIEADLLKDAIDAIVNRADGTISHQVGVREHSVVSTDGDATWRSDEERGSFTSSVLLVVPVRVLQKSLVDPKLELSVIGMTTVDGVRTTHLRFQTPDREPFEVWIAEDAKLGPHVNRIRGPFTVNAGDWDLDVTYSKFNELFDIRLPEVS
jgi:hypothetical protein